MDGKKLGQLQGLESSEGNWVGKPVILPRFGKNVKSSDGIELPQKIRYSN